MRSIRLVVLSGSVLLLCLAPIALSQRIVFDRQSGGPDKTGYWATWEPSRERLIFYRDSHEPASPSVSIVERSGKNIALYPGKEFPGSDHIDIWAVTGAANGDIIISAIVAYGPPKAAPYPTKS